MAYFLLVDGIGGGSTDAAHPGWFEVDSYAFDLTAATGAPAGGGAGKPQFAPLEIGLALDTGLTRLLAAAATGRAIPSARLQSVTEQGEAVYDLALGAVQITGLHDVAGPGDSLSLSYGSVSLTTSAQAADGSLLPPENFSFDLVANRSLAADSTLLPGTSGSDLAAQPTDDLVLVQAGSALATPNLDIFG